MMHRRPLILALFLLSSLVSPLEVDSKAVDVGPGGGGQFTEFDVNPSNPSHILAATNVGGIALSTDGGVSFTNVSECLSSVKVNSVQYRSSKSFLVGTSDGIYRSNDEGKTCSLMDTGMAKDTAGQFDHPIQTVRVAPSDPNVLWAATGDPAADAKQWRDVILYNSTDGGANWTKKLVLKKDSAKDLERIQVSFSIDPTDSKKVWIASSKGFFYTKDGGTNIYELGIPIVKKTKDAGVTWQSCNSTASGCVSAFYKTSSVCSVGSSCLPTDVSDVDVRINPKNSSPELYVTVRDLGFAFNNSSHACTTRFNDTELAYFKGGPYKSTDGGLTWARILTAEDGTQPATTLRCNANTSLDDTSVIYNHIQVDPNDANHYLISAHNNSGGIYEHYISPSTGKGTWTYWNGNSVCGVNAACFEGGESNEMWRDTSTSAVNVRSFAVTDWNPVHPSFLVSGARILYKGTYNKTLGRYSFDFLDADYDTSDPAVTGWKSTGINDYCSRAFIVTKDDQKIVSSGSDSGLITAAKNASGSFVWNRVSADVTLDESKVLLQDAETGNFYATSYQNRVSASSVILTSTDQAKSWTSIGGLSTSLTTNALAVDYSSPLNKRKILAATEAGLYVYDSSSKKWSRVDLLGNGSGAKLTIKDILTSPDWENQALLTVIDPSAPSKTGVYLLSLHSGPATAVLLKGGEDNATYNPGPNLISLVQNTDGSPALLVSGLDKKGSPVIQRTSWNFKSTAISWKTVFNKSIANKSILGFADSGHFAKQEISTFSVDPQLPTHIILSVHANPTGDAYVPKHIYESTDGGKSFTIASDNFSLAIPNIDAVTFSPSGEYIYFAPRCASIYQVKNPLYRTP